MPDSITLTVYFRSGASRDFVLERARIGNWGWRVTDDRLLVVRPEKGLRHEIPFDSLDCWTVDTRTDDTHHRAVHSDDDASADERLQFIVDWLDSRGELEDHSFTFPDGYSVDASVVGRGVGDAQVRGPDESDGDDHSREPIQAHDEHCGIYNTRNSSCTCGFYERSR